MLHRSSHLCLCLMVSAATAADPPAKKITPGQAVVPERMRRLWGELVSLDLKTRTGTFRNEVNGEIMPFTVLPYAELLHHAANGDLQDFRVGEHALFRLHEDEKGKWVWLTYIQDEMNFLKNHGSYYWVDAVDPATGQISFTRSNAKKTEVGEKGVMETDAATRFWKDGKPAAFKDIKVGDKLRAKTHGTGKGKTRVCWEVFLDDASLERFQTDQQAVHLKRLGAEGLAGYVDSRDGKVVRLTLFQETRLVSKDLKPGQKVRLAPAGADRKPTAVPVSGRVTSISTVRKLFKVVVTLDADSEAFAPPGLVRVWVEK